MNRLTFQGFSERRAAQLIAQEMTLRAASEEDHEGGPRESGEKADGEAT